MKTIKIEGMDVPSCGKFEIEWALRQIMGNPGVALQYLANAIYEHFKGEAQDDCIKWAIAANRAYTQLKIRTFVCVEECLKCEGRGGFMDTTYDRTGAWEWCHACHGYGHTYNPHQFYKLMGVPKVDVPKDGG